VANTPSPKGPPGDKGKSRGSVERAMALRDVLKGAVELEKEVRKASGPPRESRLGKNILMALSVGIMAFTGFAYVSRPEFIFGADPTNVSEVRRDANVRFTMYLLSRRVESFKATDASRKYPESLSAIVGAPKGVSYAKLTEDLFELRAKDGEKEIVFRSNEPAERFLGQAPKILSGRSQ
jgi:hypothetical protein